MNVPSATVRLKRLQSFDAAVIIILHNTQAEPCAK